MKRRISSHIRWIRFLFVAVGLALIYSFTSSLIDNNIDQEEAIVELGFLIVCVGVYYLIDKAKVVEFDHNFMYLTGKAGEEKIPLKEIYNIKLTMTEINNRNMWKIDYFDNDGAEKSVRILPRWSHKHLDEFKDYVKAANKDAKIKNWTHSFDFDQ